MIFVGFFPFMMNLFMSKFLPKCFRPIPCLLDFLFFIIKVVEYKRLVKITDRLAIFFCTLLDVIKKKIDRMNLAMVCIKKTKVNNKAAIVIEMTVTPNGPCIIRRQVSFVYYICFLFSHYNPSPSASH